MILQTGFDESSLSVLLQQFGFCEVKRVRNYNLLSDTSRLEFKGYFISLNLMAEKCQSAPSKEPPSDDIPIPPLQKLNVPYEPYDGFY